MIESSTPTNKSQIAIRLKSFNSRINHTIYKGSNSDKAPEKKFKKLAG